MDKYKTVGLDVSLINEKYPNLNEYDEIASFYLSDENFKLLGQYIEDEDYAMAFDATKGLYVLASELRMMRLYEALLEVYEDIEYEVYEDIRKHYDEMMEIYQNIRRIFYV